MSAFLQSKAHVDAILRAALDGPADWAPRYPGSGWWFSSYWHGGTAHPVRHEEAERLGAMLVAENVRSVRYRYPDDKLEELPGPLANAYAAAALEGRYEWPAYGTGPVRIAAPPRALTAVEALKALDGYEYQACEHPGWETSEAAAFCSALRSALIGALPGYEEAETWSI